MTYFRLYILRAILFCLVAVLFSFSSQAYEIEGGDVVEPVPTNQATPTNPVTDRFLEINNVHGMDGATRSINAVNIQERQIEVAGKYGYQSTDYRDDQSAKVFMPLKAVPIGMTGMQTELLDVLGNSYICSVHKSNITQYINASKCELLQDAAVSQTHGTCLETLITINESKCTQYNVDADFANFTIEEVGLKNACFNFFRDARFSYMRAIGVCNTAQSLIEDSCIMVPSDVKAVLNTAYRNINLAKQSYQTQLDTTIPASVTQCEMAFNGNSGSVNSTAQVVAPTANKWSDAGGSAQDFTNQSFTGSETSGAAGSSSTIDPRCADGDCDPLGSVSGLGDSGTTDLTAQDLGLGPAAPSLEDASAVASQLDSTVLTKEDELAALSGANPNGEFNPEIRVLEQELGIDPEDSNIVVKADAITELQPLAVDASSPGDSTTDPTNQNTNNEDTGDGNTSTTVAALAGPNMGELATVAAGGLLSGFLGSMQPQAPQNKPTLPPLPPPGGLVLPPPGNNGPVVMSPDANQINSPDFRNDTRGSRTTGRSTGGFDQSDLGGGPVGGGDVSPRLGTLDSQYGSSGGGSGRSGSGGGGFGGSSSLSSGGGGKAAPRGRRRAARSAFGSGSDDDPMFLNKSGGGGGSSARRAGGSKGSGSSGGSLGRRISSLFGGLKNKITGNVDPKFDHQKYIPDLYKQEKITKFSLPEPEDLDAHNSAYENYMERKPAMELCLPHEDMWEKVSQRYTVYCKEGVQAGCRKEI